jgi:hypothetical protein
MLFVKWPTAQETTGFSVYSNDTEILALQEALQKWGENSQG